MHVSPISAAHVLHSVNRSPHFTVQKAEHLSQDQDCGILTNSKAGLSDSDSQVFSTSATKSNGKERHPSSTTRYGNGQSPPQSSEHHLDLPCSSSLNPHPCVLGVTQQLSIRLKALCDQNVFTLPTRSPCQKALPSQALRQANAYFLEISPIAPATVTTRQILDNMERGKPPLSLPPSARTAEQQTIKSGKKRETHLARVFKGLRIGQLNIVIQ